MDFNDRLQAMKNFSGPVPREEGLRETISAAQKVWLLREETQLMTYGEFLWTQLRYTRKRWWAMQGICLLMSWMILPVIDEGIYRVRVMGVLGCLFVIFMIPELWRNKESDSTQVEAACLYSLRQIYSARLTLFGMMDMILLTLFCFLLRELGFTLMEVISQFLMPATVTACICFSLLCGKKNWSEAVSLMVCLTWCAAWWLILLNDALYTQIVPAVWVGLFGTALAFLVMAVRKVLCTTNQSWEVILA